MFEKIINAAHRVQSAEQEQNRNGVRIMIRVSRKKSRPAEQAGTQRSIRLKPPALNTATTAQLSKLQQQ
jgi:hypothetical protein